MFGPGLRDNALTAGREIYDGVFVRKMKGMTGKTYFLPGLAWYSAVIIETVGGPRDDVTAR